MSCATLNISTAPEPNRRPLITSYDSDYEHSLEHYVAVRRLVDEADIDAGRVIAEKKDSARVFAASAG